MIHRSESDLFLDDIIFQNRNKSYGAYIIRREYNSHLKVALFIAVFAFCASFLTFILPNLFTEKLIVKAYPITSHDVFDLPEIIYNYPPPPVENVKPSIASNVTTTRSVNLKIVDDSQVIKEATLPSEITGIVGNEDHLGTDEETAILPGTTDSNSGTDFNKTEDNKVYSAVGVFPEFDGNHTLFLQSNIRYPSTAINNNIEGKVYVEYVLEKDGSINDVKVVRGIGYGCDEEAIRVVKLMSGKWKPGLNNGQPVKFKAIIPIYFKLAS